MLLLLLLTPPRAIVVIVRRRQVKTVVPGAARPKSKLKDLIYLKVLKKKKKHLQR